MSSQVASPPHVEAQLVEALRRYWGYDSFLPLQAEAMGATMARQDSVVVLPTGGGKSLCYQAPAVCREGLALVVSPLISLMKDQVDALQACGVPAAAINSTLTPGERRIVAEQIRRGELKLVYVAPERLLAERTLEFFKQTPLSLIAIDEAHCISQWGHDFRPSYRRLQGLKQQLDVPVLALTATATRAVARDILRQLGMNKPAGFKGSFLRPNLRIATRKKGQGGNTRGELLALVRSHAGESGIVYCQSRKGVEQTAAWLVQNGVRARAYHAGLDPVERAQNQDAFQRDDIDVVVATVAFGMGIDKPNVRFVVHRDMPKDIESWYQEIGRAGRDGLPSDCVLFYSWADVKLHERFLDRLEDDTLRKRTRTATVALFDLVEQRRCRHQALVAHFDEVIEPCGTSCDHCTGETIEERLAQVAARQRSRQPGAAKSATARGSRSPSDALDLDNDERLLFDALRALRRELADRAGMPAYIVFGDRVLLEMVAQRPRTLNGMLRVPGVGHAKLERYGAAFLEVIRQHIV
jgi:ATP-dependent DNA helicase RecQ